MKIRNRKIGGDSSCFIIGEIGSNHNKDLDKAYKLIDIAAEAGVNAVKFQTLKPTDIAKLDTPADEYGKADFTKNKEYWYEVLQDFVLPFKWHKELFDYVRSKGLIPLSTPESLEAVELLEDLEISAYKVASMDITYIQLLKRIAQTGKPVILSSGIADIDDIIRAIKVLKENGTEEIAVLHCVSDYPPKYNYMSLEMISYYKEVFNIPVGFSDHCEDNLLDGVAVSLGADIVEKHITLDKNSYGPDHNFALEPEELKNLVDTIRKTEKALPINKKLYKKKEKKKKLFGRSIISTKNKKPGEIIKKSDIDYKRPGTGIEPIHVDKLIGLTLKKSIEKHHIFSWDDFK